MLDIHVENHRCRIACSGEVDEVFGEVAISIKGIYKNLNTLDQKIAFRLALFQLCDDDDFWETPIGEQTSIRGPVAEELLRRIFETKEG